MSASGAAGLTFTSGSMLLLLGAVVCIAAGAAGAALIGPKDNKAMSALMGGALTAMATIPGLIIGIVAGLLQ